jgi:hypothetical protein
VLQVLIVSDVVDTVRAYATQHPHPAVTALASHVLGGWQRTLLAHLRALTNPGLLKDPVAALEARVAANQIQYPPGEQAVVALRRSLR